MGLLRDLECKLFHRSPIVDCNNRQKYPLKSLEELQFMNDYLGANWDMICVFPFVQITDNDKYIEIYVWEKFLCPKPFVRFILHEGERLPDEEEELYLEYFCSDEETSEFSVDAKLWERFNADVVSAFPQWHCLSYNDSSIGLALLHLYYASHRSGPREILYKANLELIGHELEKLSSYFNILGTTPSDIVGKNAPIRFLRMMNRPNFLSYYLENCTLCLQVYRQYAGYIGEHFPTSGQWAYLTHLYQKQNAFASLSFSRTIYMHLASVDGEFLESQVIAYYLGEYYSVFKAFRQYRRIRIPPAEKLSEIMEQLDRIGESIEICLEYIPDFRARKEMEHDLYEYSEEKFSVILPDNPYDICEEAITQSNCLMEYIEAHALKETTILFIRKNTDPAKPFVTMEVDNGKVEQVYAACNTLPSIEVYEFLLRYCKTMSLQIDTYSLIMDGSHSLEGLSAELEEYANKFCREGKEVEDTEKNEDCGLHEFSKDDLDFSCLDDVDNFG